MLHDLGAEDVAALDDDAQRLQRRPRPRVRHRDRLQRTRLGQRVRRAGLVEHERDADGIRVGEVRQSQCVGVVHDVLTLADRPAAVGRDLRQRRAMLRAGVRTGPVDEGDPVLQVRRARIGEAGHELVEQRAALGQRHRVEPL